MEKRVRWLDSVRGLACLIVLLVHIAASGARLKPYTSGCGKIGVWAFMVLSGLFLFGPWLRKNSRSFGPGDVLPFYKKRLFKVYPLYLAAVAVYAFVYGEFGMPEAVRSIIRHGLLLEAWGHFWYMPVIIKFYLAAPVFLLLLTAIRKRFLDRFRSWTAGMLVTVSAISIALYPPSRYVENSTSLWFYLPVFLMGMGLALFWDWKKEKDGADEGKRVYDGLALFGILAILIVTPPARKVLFGIEPGSFLQNQYLYLGAVWVMILAGIGGGRWFRTLLNRAHWLQRIGDSSYEIYLIHYIMIMTLMKGHMTFLSRAAATVIITSATVLLIQWLRWYWDAVLKHRKWQYLMGAAGVLFGISYVCAATSDVVYSDYIRLVNSYLPDVWNPEKFFVSDLLARVPVNYLNRIINTEFFHYSVRFDQILGVLGLGASALVTAAYCRFRRLGNGWMLLSMAVLFSLNKWEMLNNGTGWAHFWALAGFYYHYLVFDRVWAGQAKKGDHIRLLTLPWVMILAVAGPYCASYGAALFLAYPFCLLLTYKRERVWKKEYFWYLISAVLPFLLYLISNFSTESDWSGYHVAEGSIVAWLFDIPGYFIRFFVKSLSSMVVGQEAATAVFATNLPYLILGALVAAAYGLALWFQWKHRLYEKTLLPLLFLAGGLMNHGLIVLARWKFLVEDYGMGSRYALQFQIGIVGILLTFGLVWKKLRLEGVKRKSPGRYRLAVGLTAAFSLMFLSGNLYTTYHELGTAPHRKAIGEKRVELALDFENRTDDELRENFEYRTSRPESGSLVRQALTILKENHWNVFYEEGR